MNSNVITAYIEECNPTNHSTEDMVGTYLEVMKDYNYYDYYNKAFFTYKLIGDMVFIADLFVKKEARNKLVFKTLANKIIQIARDTGKTVIMGHTERTNIPMKKAMESVGMIHSFSDSDNNEYYFRGTN